MVVGELDSGRGVCWSFESGDEVDIKMAQGIPSREGSGRRQTLRKGRMNRLGILLSSQNRWIVVGKVVGSQRILGSEVSKVEQLSMMTRSRARPWEPVAEAE